MRSISAERVPARGSYTSILNDLNYDCPEVGGGILEDAPGMGKTYTKCGSFSWFASHHKHLDDKGKPDHRPSLLLVPDGYYVFKKWVDVINDHFPNIGLIVANKSDAYTTDPTPTGRPKRRYIAVGADEITGTKQWPEHLEYIFDKAKPRASRTLRICSYAGWRKRVLVAKKIRTPKDDENAPPREHWWVRFKGSSAWRSLQLREECKDRWTGAFKMTLLDEGHQLRNTETQMHWAVRHLHAPINWILSATPIVKKATDVTNITQIIWPATEKRLKAHPGWDEISAKYDEALLSEKPWTFLDWLSHDGRTIGGKAVKDDNTWELLYLNPYMLGALLQEGTDPPLIAHHYEKFDR